MTEIVHVASDKPVLPPGDGLVNRFEYRATGLLLPDDFTYDEWAVLGGSLQTVAKAWQWWIGDWLQYGEQKYGEKYAAAIEVTGHEYQALANAAWVAGQVQFSSREENCT